MSTTALVLHRVEDYDAWHSTYTSLKDLRNRHGVISDEVLRPLNGENLVALTHEFDSPEAARAYFSSEELQGAMAQAGVDPGSVELHLLQRA